MSKRLFFILFFFSGLFFLLHLMISFNEGFSLKKVLCDLPEHSKWQVVKITNDPLLKALDKPFTYLGRGGQAFVFESEDKKYVIKLIRYDLLTPTLNMRLSDYFFKDEPRFKRKKKRFLEANQSYYDAYTKLSEETNVLYSHLVKTEFFGKKITLIDKLKKRYTVELDNLGFILQKKVTLLGEVLEDLKAKEDRIGIEKILTDYLSLLKRRTDKGFWIKDHNQFLRNYGRCEGKVFEIDVGSYRYDNLKTACFFQKNNLDHLKRLHLWIEDNLPEHLAFFDQKIEEIILENAP